MQLHQFRTDGQVDVTELGARDMPAAKITALALVARPEVTGVYRIKFVDAEYDRDCFDTYHLPAQPELGALMFAGVA